MSKEINGLKHCPKCGLTKTVSEFNKNKSRLDGHSDYCRVCTRALNNANMAKRRQDPAFREKQATYMKKWRDDNREEINAKQRERQQTPEWKEYRKQWYHESNNKEYQREWRKRNPDKPYLKRTAEQEALRSARKRTQKLLAPEDRVLSVEYRKAIKNDPCFYCGQRTQKMHDDHKMPLAKGGTDHWYNLARACAVCNLSKGARCEDHFRAGVVCDCEATLT